MTEESLILAELTEGYCAMPHDGESQMKKGVDTAGGHDPPSWMEVMLGGQLTRDPALKTRGEQLADRARAEALDAERRKVSLRNRKPA